LVQGTGFNWPQPDHFRVVYLPMVEELDLTLDKLALFLKDYDGAAVV
jgi:alanine-synthesizing transaminase